LEADDYEEAKVALGAAIEMCGTAPVGEQAGLALAIAAADPRHDEPSLAAAVTSAYLSQPHRSVWGRQMAESVYLLALSTGGEADDATFEIPGNPPESFPPECSASPSRLSSTRASGDLPDPPPSSPSVREAELEARILELQAELERIQETLRP
jgi:hypothetical protein